MRTHCRPPNHSTKYSIIPVTSPRGPYHQSFSPHHRHYDLSGLLSAATAPHHAAELHAYLITSNSLFRRHLYSLLVSLYARCNLLSSATAALLSLPSFSFSAAACTSVLARFSRSPNPASALSLFSLLRHRGLLPHPNPFTFSSLLPSCRTSSTGSQLHSLTLKHGTADDLFVSSALADMYAKTSDMPSAEKVFGEMPQPNIVCWNALIVGYLHNSLHQKAMLAFRELLLSMMPDQVSFSSALSACTNSAAINFGIGAHCLAVKAGQEALAYVKNSLIDMYVKCGHFNDASKLFNEMPDKDAVSWNIMTMSCVQIEHFEGACNSFLAMRRHCIDPDEASFSTVLHASANLADLLLGAEIHCQVVKFGFAANRCIGSSLITMYSKCGCLDDAQLAFSETKDHLNVVSWTAMIAALQQHGHGSRVLELFNEMLAANIKPDCITFVCVLSACSHTGLVEKGFEYFSSMSRAHNMLPGNEHYACMVDMLGRAGRLDEAKQFIDKLPFKPEASVWGALLGACRNRRNLELGREVAYKLFEIEPHNSGNYVLLSNMYASYGKMEEANKVRRLMESNGVKKETSCSWIDMRNKAVVFTVNDRSHDRTEEIYEMLKKLEELVKEKGYVADTQFAVNDIEGHKEIGLWYHSERLALAFALISLQQDVPIRIKKNLRTCGDCHKVMKLVSGILQREIILRDNNRFHRFSDGLCSCRDYW